MSTTPHEPIDPQEFRREAEAQWEKKKAELIPNGHPEPNSDEVRQLQRELAISQIELEIQRKALLKSHAETEAALEQCTDLFDFAPTGYYNLASDGTILAVNFVGAKLAGAERDHILQSNFVSLLPDVDQERFRVYLKRIFEGEGPDTFEVSIARQECGHAHVLIETALSADGNQARANVFDVSDRHNAEIEKQKLIEELQEALEQVKQLSGLLPICASCKRIRSDDGRWVQIEEFIADHSEASFSHGLCRDCIPTFENL